MWTNLGGVPGPPQNKKKKKNLAHDPGLTPQLVQVHDLRPQAEISA